MRSERQRRDRGNEVVARRNVDLVDQASANQAFVGPAKQGRELTGQVEFRIGRGGAVAGDTMLVEYWLHVSRIMDRARAGIARLGNQIQGAFYASGPCFYYIKNEFKIKKEKSRDPEAGC